MGDAVHCDGSVRGGVTFQAQRSVPQFCTGDADGRLGKAGYEQDQQGGEGGDDAARRTPDRVPMLASSLRVGPATDIYVYLSLSVTRAPTQASACGAYSRCPMLAFRHPS
jgi:hypothetical protein